MSKLIPVTEVKVGDVVEHEVMNRIDPRFGEKVKATVDRVDTPMKGYTSYHAVSDEQDYNGLRYGGGPCKRNDQMVEVF